MAGGPNAAIVACIQCAGKANRTSEGCENDSYACEECGHRFGLDYCRGRPNKPCWPPSPEEAAAIRAFAAARAADPEVPQSAGPHRPWWRFWDS